MLTVTTSTAVAQITLILVLPIITRIVDQDEIGIYFYWVSAASIFVVLATFRLDMAVFVENNEENIVDLLQLIVVITSCVSVASIFVFVFIVPFFNLGVGSSVLSRYAFQSACLIFSLSLIQSFQAYLVYCCEYYKLGFSRVIQSISISIFLLLAAIFGFGAFGLVSSHCIGALVSLLAVFGLCSLTPNRLFREIRLSSFKKVLLKHYRFPLYSMPGDFINIFSNQLPVFIVGARFGETLVASYALTVKVMAAPISLLAGSILTVFKERSASEYRQKGECIDAYMYALRSLFKVSVVPFAIAWFLVDDVFVWIFGESWKTSGDIAQIMVPMYFLRFIANPLSYTLYIGHWQKYDLLWQISLFILTWSVFVFSSDLMQAVRAYAIGYGILYIVYLAMSYTCAKGKK